MNINMTIKCETCGTHIACRVGMSNRDIQPIRFNCQSCGSPIDMTFHKMDPTELKGAESAVVTDEIEQGNAVVITGDSFPVDDAGTRAQACQCLND